MKRQESIEVRLTKDTKSSWEEYVEESTEVANLSDLVRLSVEQKINGVIDRQAIEAVDTNVELDGTELIEKINKVDQRNNQILDQIADIHSQIDGGSGIEDLMQDIVSLLIRVPDEDTFKESKLTGMEHQDTAVAIDGTVGAFAEYFDEDRGRVRKALSRAYREYPDVEYTISPTDKRQYFRIDPNVTGMNIPDEVDTEEFKTATQIDNQNDE
jgi:hypothetical protein